MIINLISFYITSGLLLFSGTVLISLAVSLTPTRKSLLISIRDIFLLLGIIAIGISATPVNFWISAASIIAVSFYIFSIQFYMHKSSMLLMSGGATLLMCVIMFTIELPSYLFPEIGLASKKIFLIGDSLTSGLGSKHIRLYPDIINAESDLEFTNLAVAGSRMAQGVQMFENVSDATSTILIELGGNDYRLEGDNRQENYRNSLDNLLKHACNGQRQVIMFEIPFPPMEYRFNFYQRSLAKKYGVTLISRRFIADILFRVPDSTSDGIHLTQNGHDAFAKNLLKILVPC